MSRVILYTIDCPKCRVLEAKLNSKKIQYDTVKDENLMLKLGFDEMPILYVEGDKLDYKQAINWIERQ